MSGDLRKRWTKRPARGAEEEPRTLETRSAKEPRTLGISGAGENPWTPGIFRAAALLAAVFLLSGCASKNVPSGTEPPRGGLQEEVSEHSPRYDLREENSELPSCYDPREESLKLPSRYDLREEISMLPAADQGDLGTCWAFASLAAVETSMAEEDRARLSADHMIWQNGFGTGTDGGDYGMAMAYLLAWKGPVLEEQDPYGDGMSPEGLEPVCHVQEIRILPEKDYEAIKRAVYEYGGVESAVYIPADFGKTGVGELEAGESWTGEALCYQGTQEANHDIVIVGWDDHYPKENFSAKPEADGAFLCLNSWGSGFGEDGYFYVSYEDSQIGVYGISYSGLEHADYYSRIYQTDLRGWTGQMGYGSSSAWFANVYTAQETERIAACGFYATVPDTSYRVYGAVLPEEPGGAESSAQPTGEEPSGEKLPEKELSGKEPSGAEKRSDIESAFAERNLLAEGTLSYAGFYTISWEDGLFAEEGSRFALLVEIDSPGTAQPVAVEYREDSRGGSRRDVDIPDGEGYISFDGKSWQSAEENGGSRVCLKAYSRSIEKESRESNGA